MVMDEESFKKVLSTVIQLDIDDYTFNRLGGIYLKYDKKYNKESKSISFPDFIYYCEEHLKKYYNYYIKCIDGIYEILLYEDRRIIYGATNRNRKVNKHELFAEVVLRVMKMNDKNE